MNALQLKRISIADPEYTSVWELRENVLRKPLGQSLRDEDLSGERDEFIIAGIRGAEVVGCVLLRPQSGRELKLRQMAVAEASQGQGIGAAIVREAEACALENGFTSISLHARKEAVTFYERCGYGIRGEEFVEVGIPHLLMQKELS